LTGRAQLRYISAERCSVMSNMTRA
jgi:hypothetical protein